MLKAAPFACDYVGRISQRELEDTRAEVAR